MAKQPVDDKPNRRDRPVLDQKPYHTPPPLPDMRGLGLNSAEVKDLCRQIEEYLVAFRHGDGLDHPSFDALLAWSELSVFLVGEVVHQIIAKQIDEAIRARIAELKRALPLTK